MEHSKEYWEIKNLSENGVGGWEKGRDRRPISQT